MKLWASRFSFLLLAGVLGSGSALAAGPAELQRLFPKEAEVAVDAPGLVRLELSPEVLSECRADLSDLRVFDPTTGELPFLVDAAIPGSGRDVEQTITGTVTAVQRNRLYRLGAPTLERESYVINAPLVPSETGAWALVFRTGQGRFVRVVTVEALDGTKTTELVKEGSIFRLPAGGHENLVLPLPVFQASRIRVTIEGEEGFYLEPAFAFEASKVLPSPPPARVPLQVIDRQKDGPLTVLEVGRPRGLVPGALRIESTTTLFDRRVEVRDEGPASGDAVLGLGWVFRVQAWRPVERLELGLAQAHGDRLRVAITDGDSPPLDGLAVWALVPRPSLIFSASHAGKGAAVLRFGGGRAWRPQYDLAGLALEPGQYTQGDRAIAAATLYDRSQVKEAHLGEIRPNPTFDSAPALAFAMRAGVQIEPQNYSYRRALTLGKTPEGLSRLGLEPEDLSKAREDLADVRVVDESYHQWPFLLETQGAKGWVELKDSKLERKDGASHHTLSAPTWPLRVEQLVLGTDTPFFDRHYKLVGTNAEGIEIVVSEGRMMRRAGDPRAVTLQFSPVRVQSLSLVMDDGDEAPLVFSSVRARALKAEVYVAAPEGKYWVMLGNPQASAPRYDIAQVRDVVLAVRSEPAAPGTLERNPLFVQVPDTQGQEKILLWMVLGIAVLGLGGLTLHLARREPTVVEGPAPDKPIEPKPASKESKDGESSH